MAKPTEPTVQIVIETILEGGSIRARPVASEGYPPSTRVRCSKAMRYSRRVGSKFRIYAKLSDREGGRDFLTSWHGWDYETLPD